MSNSTESTGANVQPSTGKRLDPAEIEYVTTLRERMVEERDRISEAWREGKMTSDEALAATAKATWPRWSISTLGPCPSGCTVEHHPDGADEDLVSHEVRVAEIATLSGGKTCTVEWGFVDDLIDGIRQPAQVNLFGADDGLGSDAARQVATALVEAAGLADEWNAS